MKISFSHSNYFITKSVFFGVFILLVSLFFHPKATNAAVITDFVPNNSMEEISTANPTLPDSWVQSGWGTNTAVYEYASDGHDGTRSVKVTVTNYVDGDVQWDYTPQALTPGNDYKFTAWYKTDSFPQVVAHYIKNDGTETFFGLPKPLPNGPDWQQYSDVFTVPADVKAVSVYFFLAGNGWLQTDDYHITPYQYTSFDQGIVTLTFDDGFEQNITTALPILAQYGFKMTECVATQYLEGIPEQEANIKLFSDAGHEICSHSVTHPYLTASTTQLNYELTHPQNYLRTLTGQPIQNFSSPFGDYNASVNNEIKKYYSSHRTTDEGFNSKDNLDVYRLRVQNMLTSTTLEQFQGWVNKAKTDKTWLILLYHVIGPQIPEQYDTLQEDFNAQMAFLSSAGIPVKRWDQALAEVTGTTSTTSPTHTISLQPGWNLVNLPIQTINNYTAESLGVAMGADVVAQWTASNQQYTSHVVGNPINDFAISNGEGFFIHAINPISLTLSGTAISPALTTSAGWNIVAPSNLNNTTASALATFIAGADVVARYNSATQQWISHVAGNPINDFTISRGEAVFVHKN